MQNGDVERDVDANGVANGDGDSGYRWRCVDVGCVRL